MSSSAKNRFRVIGSYVNSKARMVQWGGVMVVASEKPKGKPESIEHVNFKERPSLDFDSVLTFEDIDILHCARHGDYAIFVKESAIVMSKISDADYYEEISVLKCDPPLQIITDLTQAIYVRTGTSIIKVYLETSFKNRMLDHYFLKEDNCHVISARDSILACLSINRYGAPEHTLSVKKYSEEGVLISNRSYALDLMEGYNRAYKVTDEGLSVKTIPKKTKTAPRSKAPSITHANMCIASAGVLILMKVLDCDVYKCILFYYRVNTNNRSLLLDSKEVTPKNAKNLKPFNLKRHATLFEQRGTPAALVWHPDDPTCYSLYAFQNGRFNTLLNWGQDSIFTKRLRGIYEMKVPRTEFDYKTMKLILCTVRNKEGLKNLHAVFMRVRFTF